MDAKINTLKPGQAVEISRTTAGYCTAERSGDGRTLRFVRHIGQTSTVYHTEECCRMPRAAEAARVELVNLIMEG